MQAQSVSASSSSSFPPLVEVSCPVTPPKVTPVGPSSSIACYSLELARLEAAAATDRTAAALLISQANILVHDANQRREKTQRTEQQTKEREMIIKQELINVKTQQLASVVKEAEIKKMLQTASEQLSLANAERKLSMDQMIKAEETVKKSSLKLQILEKTNVQVASRVQCTPSAAEQQVS